MGIIEKHSSTELVINYILDKVNQRELKPGEQLPNEREFAEMLGVSRMPIREAFSALSLLGILEAKQGSGTYIKHYDASTFSEIMNLYAVLDNISIEELYEFRAIIESQAVKLVIERSSDEDIAEIEREVEAAGKALADLKTGKTVSVSKDNFLNLYNFHSALSRATKNRYLMQVMDAMRLMSQRFYIECDDDPIVLFGKGHEQHKVIMEAIKARDTEHATKLLYAHLVYEGKGLSKKE